jgi:lipoprotein-releasing system permease protein
VKTDSPQTDAISHKRAWIELVLGALMILGGVIFTVATFDKAGNKEASGTHFVAAFGPVLLGFGVVMHALSDLAGYRSFVAWRYLLVAQPRVTRRAKIAIGVAFVVRLAWWGATGEGFASTVASLHNPFASPQMVVSLVTTGALIVLVFWGVLRHSRPAMWMFVIGLVTGIVCNVVIVLMVNGIAPFLSKLNPEVQVKVVFGLGIAGLVGWGFTGLATFFGAIRAFFTFFTTVPIGGVWIGTSALVCVLSVMSGFESDLREKILGSNAHIQITRDDGSDFTDWREIKARIDHVPGVVASTPYATSEVVIAAHNNGMNVIIKGIDTATVAKVTDLVSDLEDKEAIKRLEPLVEDRDELVVPQKPHDENAVDPAPDDLPTAGDPMDFSSDAKPETKPDAKTDAKTDANTDANTDAKTETKTDAKPDAKTGTGSAATPADVMDAPPADLVVTDQAPRDFSTPPTSGGTRMLDPESLPINVVDFPESTVSKRTQSLPGILVGRELRKQTHLYTGEEVRVVSPLSDPSNPDATGTPIPFNRDYRVAGFFFTGMYEYDLKYVYVTLDSLQDFLDRGDSIEGIEVRIGDPDDTAHFVSILGKELGAGYRIVDWRELNRSLFSALKLEKIAMFLVLGIVILVASFSIVGNLIMVVVEKAREIALLKTLGASNYGVMQLFAIQGLMIGLIGTALGITTGLVACWAGRRFGLPLNPDVYYIDRLPIHVDPQSVAAAAAAGILISIAATLYPALLAAQVRPAAGMRH